MSAKYGWSAARLGDHANIKARIGWKGLQASEYRGKGFIFLATPNIKGHRIDFDNVNFISERRYIESPELMLQVGDVLLVKDGSTLGISNLVRRLPGPSTVNGSIAVLRCSEKLSPAFLHQVTKAHAFQKLIYDKKSGLGVPHLFQADLRDFEIPLPSLAEQCRIAEILDTLDETIRRTEQVIAKLQRMKQGLLHDLLTRGLDDNGELRDPERHPEQFKESRLGYIPRGWEVSSVAKEFEVASGFTLGPHRQPKRNPHPYLRVANVYRDRLNLDDIAFLEAKPSELLEKTLMPKDLLVVEGHANPMEIGRCAMATEAVSGFAFQNHLFRLRPFSISAEFGLYWMNSYIVQNYWWRVSSSSSGLSTINRTKLNAVPVLVPNSDEQERIRLVLDQVSERMISEKLQKDKLTALKSGLMDDLLTGRVRIPQAEAVLEQAM